MKKNPHLHFSLETIECTCWGFKPVLCISGDHVDAGISLFGLQKEVKVNTLDVKCFRYYSWSVFMFRQVIEKYEFHTNTRGCSGGIMPKIPNLMVINHVTHGFIFEIQESNMRS